MTHEQDIQRVTNQSDLDSAFWRIDRKLNKYVGYVLFGAGGYIVAQLIAAFLRGTL